MPPQVLLAAKLMAVFYLVRCFDSGGSYYGINVDGIPFEAGLSLTLLRIAAEALAPMAAALLLFNHGVRALSITLSLSVAFEFSLHGIGHAELFLGAFVILAAFSRNGLEPRLPRCLVVFTYLSGGLGWAALDLFELARTPAVLRLALPPATAHWVIAPILLLLAAAFSLRRFRPLAIWAGIVFHCVFRDLDGAFGGADMILASYLVFADWPRNGLAVLYDGECGFCNKTREWISKADWEGLYDWKPYQTGAGAAYGISTEALERRAHVVSPHGIDSGFQAFRVMALYNPVTYFAVAAVGIALHGASLVLENIGLAVIVVGFSPLLRPLGEVVYDWVARNRHRLPPRSCKVPE